MTWLVTAEARGGYDSERFIDQFEDEELARTRALALVADPDSYSDVMLWQLLAVGKVEPKLEDV